MQIWVNLSVVTSVWWNFRAFPHQTILFTVGIYTDTICMTVRSGMNVFLVVVYIQIGSWTAPFNPLSSELTMVNEVLVSWAGFGLLNKTCNRADRLNRRNTVNKSKRNLEHHLFTSASRISESFFCRRWKHVFETYIQMLLIILCRIGFFFITSELMPCTDRFFFPYMQTLSMIISTVRRS